jgi:hypothetical protein
MATTINPPPAHSCGNTSASKDLDNNTTKVIIRNRSGTQIANVNVGYEGAADDVKPKQGGAASNDAISLLPGDEIELDVPGGGNTFQKVNYINFATDEAPVIEIIQIKP